MELNPLNKDLLVKAIPNIVALSLLVTLIPHMPKGKQKSFPTFDRASDERIIII